MLRNRKIKINWNNQDITLLIWLVSQRIAAKQLTHFSLMVLINLQSKHRIGSLFL